MATYFDHGSSEIQAPDGLHTLYLMNPNNYVPSYSDTTPQQPPPPAAAATSMFLLNPASAAAAAAAANNFPPHPAGRLLAGIPVPSTAAAGSMVGSSNSPTDHHAEISAFHAINIVPPSHRIHYNLWPPPTDHHQQMAVGINNSAADVSSQMGFGPRQEAVMSPIRQALSLSLSSSQQRNTAAYATSLSGENEVVAGMLSPTSGGGGGGDVRANFAGNSLSTTVSAVSNGIGSSVQGVLLGSKYLKAAHELLDEVVNVGSTQGIMKAKAKAKAADLGDGDRENMDRESTPAAAAAIGCSYNSGGESGSSKQGVELSTAQRQELQVKKAKLARMLDEVIN